MITCHSCRIGSTACEEGVDAQGPGHHVCLRKTSGESGTGRPQGAMTAQGSHDTPTVEEKELQRDRFVIQCNFAEFSMLLKTYTKQINEKCAGHGAPCLCLQDGRDERRRATQPCLALLTNQVRWRLRLTWQKNYTCPRSRKLEWRFQLGNGILESRDLAQTCLD